MVQAYLFINAVLDAVTMGSAIGLMAAGLALTYGVSKIANFAHGDYATFGILAYILVSAIIHGKVTGDTLIPTRNYLGFLLAPPAGALAAFLSLKIVFERLRIRGANPLQLMVASIGLELILRSMAYIGYINIAGSKPITPGSVEVFRIMGVPVTVIDVVAPIVVIVSVAAIHLLMTRTLIGISMRATANNPQLAESLGINVKLVEGLAWVIGGGLAGLGGALYFTWRPVAIHPMETGWSLLALVFAAIVLGGLGSFFGSLVAAYIITFGYVPAATILNMLGLNPTLNFAVPLAIVIVTLLVAPQGLAGLYGRIRGERW